MKLIYSYIGHLCAYLATQIHRLYTQLYVQSTGAVVPRAYSPSLVTGVLPLAFFCFSGLLSAVQAQSPDDGEAVAVRSLQIGDAIPEALWNLPLQVVNHPEGKETITLNDYREKKLIILDFWATWCAPCITSLDKLDSIKPLFRNEVEVVPVSSQYEDVVAPFITGRKWRHFSTYGTSDLRQYFPHGTIPHQVWIRDNKVLALTGSEYTEARYIRETVEGGNPFVSTKQEDLAFDPQVPLFARMIDESGRWRSKIGVYSILTPHQPDLPFVREWWDGRSWMMTNFTITALYSRAFADMIPQPGYRRRLVIEIADSVKRYLMPPPGVGKLDRIRWFSTNTYCYHAGTGDSTEQRIYRERLRNELNTYFGSRFGIEGGIEKREVSILELAIDDMEVFHAHSREMDEPQYHTSSVHGDRISYKGIDAKNLCSRIGQLASGSDIPVVDAVSSHRIFDVSFPTGVSPMSDPDQWNARLLKIGLRLIRKMEHLDMLVIRSLKN